MTDAAAAAAAVLERCAVTTRSGVEVEALVGGPRDGAPVVAFHGFAGQLAGEPMLAALAGAGLRVHAPVWPGYGEAGGEEQIEDMLDFALLAGDIVDALGLGPGHRERPPHVIGHSMGAMIAAEMVALAPPAYDRLVLIDALGLWLDQHPIPDIFTLLPFEFPSMLFADADQGTALLAGGRLDFDDPAVIQAFLIANSRRLGTAGKILFPVPNRRLSKRLYRITNPTLLVWGAQDRLVGEPYAVAWARAIERAERFTVGGAGHMAPYERPAEVATAVATFLAAP